ncbi:MAG TPA: YciI family protein [Candidatus Saccharimonadales bacterium]
MTKYMLLYKGAATPTEDMSEDQGKEVMAKWQTWMEKVGGALVDVGAPITPNAGVDKVDDGSTGSLTALSGYSIIEADDLEAAKALVDGHPFLSEGQGNFSVEVQELQPAPF